MADEEGNTWRFFTSFWLGLEPMPDELQLKCFRAVALYGCFGEEPEWEPGEEWGKSWFEAVRPNVDRSVSACNRGRKGGRPRKSESKDDSSGDANMQEDESSTENAEPVENSNDNDAVSLKPNRKEVKSYSESGFYQTEAETEAETETERDRNSNSGSSNQNGGRMDIQYPAPPSRDEVRGRAAEKGYVYVDIDAFMESLPEMPPGTEWRDELARADLDAWNERHGAMEAV